MADLTACPEQFDIDTAPAHLLRLSVRMQIIEIGQLRDSLKDARDRVHFSRAELDFLRGLVLDYELVIYRRLRAELRTLDESPADAAAIAEAESVRRKLARMAVELTGGRGIST